MDTDVIISIVVAVLAVLMAFSAIAGVIFYAGQRDGDLKTLKNAVEDIKSVSEARDKWLEEKSNLAITAEKERNDEITKLLASTIKDQSNDLKEVLQRITRLETVCESLKKN